MTTPPYMTQFSIKQKMIVVVVVVVVVFIDTERSVLTHESYKTYNTHTRKNK